MPPSASPALEQQGQPGGSLRVLVAGTVDTWDPQLMYAGQQAFFAQRTFARGLTAYGTGTQQRVLQGDLATDTGQVSADGRSWSYTLRGGVAWQDGSPVTCEDVRRGVARTFERTNRADGVGGTNYATFLLDVPMTVTAEGLDTPVYTGPGDTAHAADLDRAVSCSGSTVTFRLRQPEPDFPRLLALPEFAPRTAAATGTDPSRYAVLSNGPYRLDKPWVVGQGGTFVRNERWDARTDPIRQALPDRVEVVTGLDERTAIQRLVDGRGDDAQAVSWVAASPTLRQESSAAVQERLTYPWTGSVDYLALNQRSAVMASPTVRQAFALATDRAAYVSATGGEGSGAPTWSVLAPTIDPSAIEPPRGALPTGDPEAARRLLVEAGIRLPVTVRVVHASTGVADTAYAALAAGWERAGFDVRLTGLAPERYYDTVTETSAAQRFDVFRGVWAADIPAPGGVLPALFDSRTNLDSAGPGQDLGYFDDAAVNRLVDEAQAATDPAERARAWTAADDAIRLGGGYVALAATKALHLHGAGVLHYEEHAVGGAVDLATVAVR